MSDSTNIEWADKTWNPWLGCRKVSEGCNNCYIIWTPPFRMRGIKHGADRHRTNDSYWKQALKWEREASRELAEWGRHSDLHGGMPHYDRPRPPRVFPSLCDWLDEEVPIAWLADFLKLIHDTPHLTWLLLTKRPEVFHSRIKDALWEVEGLDPDDDGDSEDLPRTETGHMLNQWLGGEAPKNVWIGVSAENQKRYDERVAVLVKIPAIVRFLSVEPMLERINFLDTVCKPEVNNSDCRLAGQQHFDWFIIGGESGKGARPCHIDWIRDAVKQLKSVGLPVFVKQLGKNPLQDLSDIIPASDVNDETLHPEDIGAWEHHRHNAPLHLKHTKGGDMVEWPDALRDLKVREFPMI